MATSEQNEFRLPDLGEGLEDAELIEWCVHVGQHVHENDALAKMETAKALVDVPSPRDGVIAILHGQPGQTIKVGSPLVTYSDAVAPVVPAATAPASATPNDTGKSEPAAPDQSRSVVGTLEESPADAAADGKVLAAPAVRRLARERGIDIERIAGTGIGGRVTATDIEAAADNDTDNVATAAPRRPAAAAPSPSPATADEGSVRIPFRGVRRTIAEHLRFSVTHAIHFTVMDEADIAALEILRRKLVAACNEKITVLPFVASAVCRVLCGRMGERFRRLNSTVDDDRTEIVQHRSVHLGIATDTESGLMVPVIRQADGLGVIEISRRVTALAAATRDRSIPPEQLRGSTFTISNFGSVAGRFGTPIINYPEAAILAVGRARDGVVVRNGMIGAGKLLPLSLSADHRVVDGATAATALAKIIELLQSPEQLLTPVRQGEI